MASRVLLSPGVRAKKEQGTCFKISCSVVPPMGGRDLVFKIGGGWPDNESIKVYGFTSQ